ncbi:MAG: phosphoribosylformimino-5-aminoimidazole carboxamide ribotide isomerase [Gammaproteobacteria bacterium]|jgi:phosphoribosylformimino-5-aminoimidazole carboxamide ribotide isomerase
MLIIPVLDLSRGLVVHAKRGDRKHYQPVTSVISSSSKPESVLSAFLELYPFKIIYIADLDAIQGAGNQSAIIKELSLTYDQCQLWVDAGIEAVLDDESYYRSNNVKLVLGSENKMPLDSMSEILNKNSDILLSLDFSETGLLENSYLLDETRLWPKQIIVMMLHRVGLSKGVDVACLNKILKHDSDHNIFAAGGVQNLKDLYQLNKMGVKGVLLATALHNGSITQDELYLIAKQ